MAGGDRRNADRSLLVWGTAITLLAAGLRILNLGHDSLWFDEALTRHAAVQGYFSDAVAASLGGRDHLPLLYWLTAAALRFLPEHEVVLRLPSALAGILTVPLMVALGRAMRLPRAGLWAAFLLAVSPFHIRYSQEARHYALLLFCSLLSLYFLYRAMAGGRRRDWVLFGAATAVNLLTHYSAWLLLATQVLLGAGWLLAVGRHDRCAWRRIVPAALIIGATLALLAPRALVAFRANTGASTGTTTAAPPGVWLSEAWLEFGFAAVLPAASIGIAALAGLMILIRQRRWLSFALLVTPVVAPVLLIQLLHISRFALPKYVIYALPLYLMAAGVGIAAAVEFLARALMNLSGARAARPAVIGLVALLIGLIAAPAIGAEYAAMVHDWRGAAGALGRAGPNDVALALALDTGDGFNAAGIMAPFYLDPAFRLLDGNHLQAADLEALAGRSGRVSALVLNLYRPVTLDDSGWAVTPHRGSLYAARRTAGEGDVLTQVARLLELLIPQAQSPEPRCALLLKLAQVQVVRGEWDKAGEALDAAVAPDCPAGGAERRQLKTDVERARLADALARGDRAAADDAAAALLAVDPRDEAALSALTIDSLLAAYDEGRLIVDAPDSPEPVERRRFEMPHNGDWGDVLFMHPPAAASFSVDLPPEPAELRFRVALDPQSREWGGDGVTFVVVAQPEGGEPREVFRQHVGRETVDWLPARVSLADLAGQRVTLTFITETGPAGDGTADWAGWDSPRILRQP